MKIPKKVKDSEIRKKIANGKETNPLITASNCTYS